MEEHDLRLTRLMGKKYHSLPKNQRCQGSWGVSVLFFYFLSSCSDASLFTIDRRESWIVIIIFIQIKTYLECQHTAVVFTSQLDPSEGMYIKSHSDQWMQLYILESWLLLPLAYFTWPCCWLLFF